MNFLRTGLGVMCAIALLGAKSYQGENNTRNVGGGGSMTIGKDIPNDVRSIYPRRVRDRVEEKTSDLSEEYRQIRNAEIQRHRILNDLYDIEVSMTPEYRLLKGIDEIPIAQSLITTILMPKGFVITDAYASFKTRHFSYAENFIKLQPSDIGFFSGNITIAMNDGKKNYVLVIFAHRYIQKRKGETLKVEKSKSAIAKKLVDGNMTEGTNEEEYEYALYNSTKSDNERSAGDYADSENFVSMVYQYVLPQVLPDEDVIILYERMTGSRITKDTIMDGDYISFIYNGITYKIKRDDKQGTLIYGKAAYIIENSTQVGFR